MRTAVVDSQAIVVNVLAGSIAKSDEMPFIAHYAPLYGIVSFVAIEDPTISVWIGGSYNPESGTFAPPPSPEPEQLVEEIVNDDAPIE